MAEDTPEPVSQASVTYSSILEEHDVARGQREARRKLLHELAQAKHNDGNKPNAVVAHVSQVALSQTDIPVLGNLLLKVGDVHTLNLILHSPGGDGTVVETFVALCRAQCKRFRVIVPHEAKSAATLIALGADEIIMGPPSEIGPIDAQIEAIASGIPRFISAQSFIDARDNLLQQHAELVRKGEDTSATLQMIASLDLPFIAECERLMEFGRDVGRKLLRLHMFSRSRDADSKVENAVERLSSVSEHKVHGRGIDGRTARTELGLKIRLCGQDDVLWEKVWEYYTRVEIALTTSNAAKIFETTHEMLLAVRGGGV